MLKKTIDGFDYIPYNKEKFEEKRMLSRSDNFFEWANLRRTCREFSNKPIDRKIIENIIKTANTAPSGAHKQPWIFCVIENTELKKQIRIAAEEEEKQNYETRMNDEWLTDLKPFGTNWQKPFLETAPYLIVVFKKSYDSTHEGTKKQNYYTNESVGIACGFLLAAIHHAGLIALTHTPSPMNFLSKILNRPPNEKAFLLIPVGLPADECWVPDLKRKSLDEISVWY